MTLPFSRCRGNVWQCRMHAWHWQYFERRNSNCPALLSGKQVSAAPGVGYAASDTSGDAGCITRMTTLRIHAVTNGDQPRSFRCEIRLHAVHARPKSAVERGYQRLRLDFHHRVRPNRAGTRCARHRTGQSTPGAASRRWVSPAHRAADAAAATMAGQLDRLQRSARISPSKQDLGCTVACRSHDLVCHMRT